MSRALATLLGSDETALRMQLQQLERAAGRPSADIRLATQLQQATRHKLCALGLDERDTHAREVFEALKIKLKKDEELARETLSVGDNALDIQIAAREFLSAQTKGIEIYAVKNTSLRAILKRLKPKATMKALGYRSMESMFKHEPVACILTAALVYESSSWHKQRLSHYEKLQNKDFEVRQICYIMPDFSKKWPQLAERYADQFRHNLSVLHELGTVVVLPVQRELQGMLIMTIVLGLHAANDIRARSSYLKLQQVNPDIGHILAQTIAQEPISEAELAGQRLPWKLLHWFYGTGRAAYHPESFEPHVQPEDLTWYHSSASLRELHDSLHFWQDTDILAHAHESEVVSFHVLDVALAVCNNLAFADRVLHNMREALSRELLSRYLHQENLQALIAASIGPKVSGEPTFDEVASIT